MKANYTVTVEVPAPVRYDIQYVVVCGKTRTYIEKVNFRSPDDPRWMHGRISFRSFDEALADAEAYAQREEAKRLMVEKVNEG